MKTIRPLLQGVCIGTVALIVSACAQPSAPQATNSDTTAPEVVPAPDATAPAGTAGQAAVDLDDLEDRVEDAFDADQTLAPFDVDADEEGDSIVLTGLVQTAEQKALAEQIAKQTAPNVPIVNQIRTQ
ncbi:MAG: BON domain-containing protein [Phormidesmis sp.]